MERDKALEKLQKVSLDENGEIKHDKWQRRIVFVIVEKDLAKWFKDERDKKEFIKCIENLAKKRKLSKMAKQALYEAYMKQKGRNIDEDIADKIADKVLEKLGDNCVSISSSEVKKEEQKGVSISDDIKSKLLNLE